MHRNETPIHTDAGTETEMGGHTKTRKSCHTWAGVPGHVGRAARPKRVHVARKHVLSPADRMLTARGNTRPSGPDTSNAPLAGAALSIGVPNSVDGMLVSLARDRPRVEGGLQDLVALNRLRRVDLE